MRQAAGGVTQVGLADSGCTFCVGLPGCSEQGARNRAPELGARGPFGKREWDSLSDKGLQSVVDDAVEDGLSPGGCPAKLFKDHRYHASVQGLEVEPISQSICPAFSQLFSEKFLSYNQVWIGRVDLHIQPELGALRFYDVNVSPVDGTHAARGRLSILL